MVSARAHDAPGGRVVVRHLAQVDADAAVLVDGAGGIGHHGNAALGQQVDLHQAQIFHRVHVQLADEDALARPLQREQIGQRTAGDDHAAGMDAQMARPPVQVRACTSSER